MIEYAPWPVSTVLGCTTIYLWFRPRRLLQVECVTAEDLELRVPPYKRNGVREHERRRDLPSPQQISRCLRQMADGLESSPAVSSRIGFRSFAAACRSSY
jgi:hypothetical protein